MAMGMGTWEHKMKMKVISPYSHPSPTQAKRQILQRETLFFPTPKNPGRHAINQLQGRLIIYWPRSYSFIHSFMETIDGAYACSLRSEKCKLRYKKNISRVICRLQLFKTFSNIACTTRDPSNGEQFEKIQIKRD
jgi:hypothetical protein